jgi:hypothetical protein
VATAATITRWRCPRCAHGYSGRLSTGTLAAGGTLGILIPPSVPLVIYAILAEQNIAKLFAAAMVPGHDRHAGLHDCHCDLRARVPGQAPEHDEPPEDDAAGAAGHWADRGDLHFRLRRHLRRQVHAHRRRGSGCAATFVAALLKREITWAKFKQCFYATAESSAMIFMIFLGADLMNSALALTQVPAQLAGVVKGWGLPPLVVVAAIMLFYVVLGAVMDELSMILLTIPIFFPDDHGHGLRHAQGKRGHLVRHHGADDGGLRHAGAAGGAERVRGQRHGQGRADRRKLQGRDALPDQRHHPHRLLLLFPWKTMCCPRCRRPSPASTGARRVPISSAAWRSMASAVRKRCANRPTRCGRPAFEPFMAAAIAEKQQWVADQAKAGVLAGVPKGAPWQDFADALLAARKP